MKAVSVSVLALAPWAAQQQTELILFVDSPA